MYRDIELLLAARSADDVWDQFVTVMAQRGYPHVFYSLRRFADMSRLWLASDLELRGNFPDGFTADIVGEGILPNTPWGLWSQHHRGVRSFDWAESDEANAYRHPTGMKLLKVLREHDLAAGHVVSLFGVSARVSGTVALATGAGTGQAHADQLWEESGRSVRALCEVMHLRVCALPQTIGPGVLTPRQRQVVEWAAYGKTVAEIAEILGVEATTIEKHLRLAREALGAGTTAQAILQAHQRNLIFVHDQVENEER